MMVIIMLLEICRPRSAILTNAEVLLIIICYREIYFAYILCLVYI